MLVDSSSVELQLTDRVRCKYGTHNVECDSILTELDTRKKAYARL